jgi:hypothetical protein
MNYKIIKNLNIDSSKLFILDERIANCYNIYDFWNNQALIRNLTIQETQSMNRNIKQLQNLKLVRKHILNEL